MAVFGNIFFVNRRLMKLKIIFVYLLTLLSYEHVLKHFEIRIYILRNPPLHKEN